MDLQSLINNQLLIVNLLSHQRKEKGADKQNKLIF